MDKSLYISMTGASQNALAQRSHANNLANLTTTGFRRDFEQARSMPVFGDGYATRAYAMTERPGTDLSPGALMETGRKLDVAVEGEGWLAAAVCVDARPRREGSCRADVARCRHQLGGCVLVVSAILELCRARHCP